MSRSYLLTHIRGRVLFFVVAPTPGNLTLQGTKLRFVLSLIHALILFLRLYGRHSEIRRGGASDMGEAGGNGHRLAIVHIDFDASTAADEDLYIH